MEMKVSIIGINIKEERRAASFIKGLIQKIYKFQKQVSLDTSLVVLDNLKFLSTLMKF